MATESHYTDVKFVFENTDEPEDAWALGNATMRAEGDEMVLELAEDDNQPPFCRLIGKRAGNTFAGGNAIRRHGIGKIEASWTMEGASGAGTWTENGRAYPFHFTLPAARA